MVTIIIDERTKKGKSLLDFLEKFGDEDFIKIEKPNKETIRAIEDSRNGKVIKTENLNDLLNKLNT